MKKYVFEATKKQWEKPTELKQYFVKPASVIVYAETEEEAKKLATEKLACQYYGSGTILGEAHFVRCDELPVDWSYGYGDERTSGSDADIERIAAHNVIR